MDSFRLRMSISDLGRDPENGERRLGPFFAEVSVERAADAALFVATRKRVR